MAAKRRWSDRLDNWKAWMMLIMFTAAAIGIVWKAPAVVYSAVFEERVEKTIDLKQEPVVKTLEKINENLEFQTYITVKQMNFSDLQDLQQEWAAIKGARD